MKPRLPGQGARTDATCAIALSLALVLAAAEPANAASLYRAVPLAGAGSLARLRATLGANRFLETLKLNRVDQAHALGIDTLIVADPGAAFLDLAPFPHGIAEAESLSKLLLISLRVQAFGAYEHGALIRWGPICSGGPNSPSEGGLFFANWKARDHVSTVDSTWIMPWTVNIDSRLGTAVHRYSLPGRPASHCCIRLMEDDAHWVYDWVTTRTLSPKGDKVLSRGTPVVLIGAYDFSGQPPWKELVADPGATRLESREIAFAVDLLARRGPSSK